MGGFSEEEAARMGTLFFVLRAMEGRIGMGKGTTETPLGAQERLSKGRHLTLLMLQKMRRRRTQKKTAMTPVPTRITISMLLLSSDPEWVESGCT
jgi:hypothetical protein